MKIESFLRPRVDSTSQRQFRRVVVVFVAVRLHVLRSCRPGHSQRQRDGFDPAKTRFKDRTSLVGRNSWYSGATRLFSAASVP